MFTVFPFYAQPQRRGRADGQSLTKTLSPMRNRVRTYPNTSHRRPISPVRRRREDEFRDGRLPLAALARVQKGEHHGEPHQVQEMPIARTMADGPVPLVVVLASVGLNEQVSQITQSADHMQGMNNNQHRT